MTGVGEDLILFRDDPAQSVTAVRGLFTHTLARQYGLALQLRPVHVQLPLGTWARIGTAHHLHLRRPRRRRARATPRHTSRRRPGARAARRRARARVERPGRGAPRAAHHRSGAARGRRHHEGCLAAHERQRPDRLRALSRPSRRSRRGCLLQRRPRGGRCPGGRVSGGALPRRDRYLGHVHRCLHLRGGDGRGAGDQGSLHAATSRSGRPAQPGGGGGRAGRDPRC